MNKKPITLTLMAILLLLSRNVKSQTSFSHSLGGSVFFASDVASGWGLMYSPRLNVLEIGSSSTLSVGTHLTVGISGTSNSQSGSTGKVCFDLPLVAELNFGTASNPDNEDSFGGFVGAGFGYNKLAYSENTAFGNVSGNFSASGILLNGGLRTNLIFDKTIGLRASYLINIKSGGANVIGIGLFYTL